MFMIQFYPKRAILLVLLVCALLFAACGGSEETPTPAPTAPPAPTDTPLPPTNTPAATNATVNNQASTTVTESASISTAGAVTNAAALTNTGSVSASSTATNAAAAPVSPLAQPQSPLSPAAAPAEPPTPTNKAGTGAIVGRLLSKATGQPLNQAIVRLADVVCPSTVKDKHKECISALDTAQSPGTFTDANGYFVFANLEPHDYVVMMSNMMNELTKLKDESGPIIWTVTADKVLNIGEFKLDAQ